MKVVILAGGLGSRIGNLTESIPKPLIEINGKPLLIRVMEHYSNHGFNDFIIALGYKGDLIKSYFQNLKLKFSKSLKFDFAKENVSYEIDNTLLKKWRVQLVDTGLNTMTGGRLKRLQNYIKNEKFLLTYGDGVSDVDIKHLIKFHNKSKSYATVTAVHPNARFGNLVIDKFNKVTKFKEKIPLRKEWINGGFFVMENNIFKYLSDDLCELEREPLEKLALDKKLSAFKHEGFWHCVDTKRDIESLESILVD